jgi:hypothetical protein
MVTNNPCVELVTIQCDSAVHPQIPNMICRKSDPLQGCKHEHHQNGTQQGFALEVAPLPAPQPSQESQSIDLNRASEKKPQIHTTKQSLPESPPPEPSARSPQPEHQANPRELPSLVAETVQQDARISMNWRGAVGTAQQETAAHLENTHRAEQLSNNQIIGWDIKKEP